CAGALRRLARRVKAGRGRRRGGRPATRGCFPPPGLSAWQRGESALTLEPERTQHREYGVVKAYLVKAAVVAAGLGLAGSALAQDDLRFVVVSHGQAADPFWSVVKNGVDEAASELGVSVEYRAPTTFNMVEMAQLIDAAVASQPDGLVVSIPDAAALGDSIRNAVAAGIPVVSMNSGSDVREELGVAVHVGQTEYEAGLGGGKRMKEAGVTKAICVNQEVGNVALDLRCE